MKAIQDEAPRAGAGEWSRPGTVEQIAPDVHRIPLPLPGDGLTAVNVYALVHGDAVTLVDSGWSFGPGFDVLERALGVLDLEPGQIDRVLVTHFHRDHLTLAFRLRELFGSRVLLGIGEQANLENVIAGKADGQRSWLRRWGAESLRAALDAMPAPPDSRYEQPDTWIAGPAELEVGTHRLRAIPTPGHTRGHLVFADEGHGLLFSGDHVLPQITPSIAVESLRSDLPLGDFLSSLQLMKELPDLHLLPAHGPSDRRSHQRVDELLDHHERRLRATYDVVRGGAASALDVAGQLPWTRRERSFTELDPHNQLLAVAETAAHLDVLVRDGMLAVAEVDGIRTYELPSGGSLAHRDE